MTTCKRGDVVLVPFPFSDRSAVKKLPAIVISSSPLNNHSRDYVIIAVTSTIHTVSTFGHSDCIIAKWEDAGLLKPSVVKPAISTIEKSIVLRKLGELSVSDRKNLDTYLKTLFDLY